MENFVYETGSIKSKNLKNGNDAACLGEST